MHLPRFLFNQVSFFLRKYIQLDNAVLFSSQLQLIKNKPDALRVESTTSQPAVKV
jgi:hypothetical protein